MNNLEVKEILIRKGVNHLYHANSVLTSLTYLHNGGLISRETVEKFSLPQTPQSSDETDKDLGIYNDIFFDSVDIHERKGDVNHYGPITFVYNINVLNELGNYDICVTKDNPVRWECSTPICDRYFQNQYELDDRFVRGTFSQHITIREISVPLDFKHLEKIIIDNPKTNYDMLTNAIAAMQEAIDINNIETVIEVRNCLTDCNCDCTYAKSHPGYIFHRFKTKSI